MAARLEKMTIQLPITVIGAGVGDIVASTARMPISGEDIECQLQDKQVGGCAMNVLRTLANLGATQLIAGITVGDGEWGQRITEELCRIGVKPILTYKGMDNGWCLALVEPDGERTFISLPGCEGIWDEAVVASLRLPKETLLYVNGYELSIQSVEALRTFILNQPNDRCLFVDLGPRIAAIAPDFLHELFKKKVILTLNRDEIAHFGNDRPAIEQAQQLANLHDIDVICRLDKEGAWVCSPHSIPTHCAIYPVDIQDTIGAGDAHCGGVLAGLASGLSLIDAVDLGNKVAAIVVSRCGADTSPTKDEIIQRFG